jgi:glycosyltransferase involved in cell wall biosynthesis
MTIELVFITYNRLYYTRLALASVLADPSEQFSLTIWDNGSTDGTVEYLKNEVSDSRISDVIFSKENIGQTEAANRVWSRSKAELLGKLDNDCLVSGGWMGKLAQAHADIDNLGVVACWHFRSEDFNYERASHKIQRFGRHQILRHPWTCGTGILLKAETFRKLGPIQNRATTTYWLTMAQRGYINGFYYPLVCQEHMDDPKSRYCQIRDERSYDDAVGVTAGLQSGNYTDLSGRLRWRREILRNLLDDPVDPKYYVGWRRKWRAVKQNMARLVHSSPVTDRASLCDE